MRQSPFWMEERRRGVGSVRVGLLALVVLVWTGWGGVPLVTTADVGSSSLATGVVSGLFVAGAAIAAVVSLRRHAERLAGWAAVAGALVAGQALLVALPTVAHAPISATERSPSSCSASWALHWSSAHCWDCHVPPTSPTRASGSGSARGSSPPATCFS